MGLTFQKFNTMKNITENPQNISELLKAKVESFQVEELDSRLEMVCWKKPKPVNVACYPSIEEGEDE
jgi:hypothetical protein